MLKSAVKVIGITLGDPAGIGAEVTAKALSKIKKSKGVSFLIIGDSYSQRKYFSRLSTLWKYHLIDLSPEASIIPGRPTTDSSKLSYEFLKTSVALLKNKAIAAVVTAPVSKEGIHAVDPHFVGHTEFYAEQFKVKNYDMMFVTDELKTIIVTRHVPVTKVSGLLTHKKILDSIILADESLRKYFGIRRPSIAVCGLNPHAGEGGKIGREEIAKIIPAIEAARKYGVNVAGPFSADTLFTPHKRKSFDVIISMFHDQGLIAIKTLCFDKVVNLTTGLPFIRTSPAHGTAFDIAGRGKADASSMYHAITLAVSLSS